MAISRLLFCLVLLRGLLFSVPMPKHRAIRARHSVHCMRIMISKKKKKKKSASSSEPNYVIRTNLASWSFSLAVEIGMLLRVGMLLFLRHGHRPYANIDLKKK